MKKIAILMLVLIMSISLPIIATAAGLPAPAVSAVQSGEAANSVPDEVTGIYLEDLKPAAGQIMRDVQL